MKPTHDPQTPAAWMVYGGRVCPWAMLLCLGCHTVPEMMDRPFSVDAAAFSDATLIRSVGVIYDSVPRVNIDVTQPGAYSFALVTTAPRRTQPDRKELVAERLTVTGGSVLPVHVMLQTSESQPACRDYWLECLFQAPDGNVVTAEVLLAASW